MKRLTTLLYATAIGAVLIAALAVPACSASITGTVKKDRLTEINRIAVMPFTMPAAAPQEEGTSLAEQLMGMLLGSRFSVVERLQLQKVMEEHKLSESALVDEATALKLGGLAGADGILLGRVVTYTDKAAQPDSDFSYLTLSIRLLSAKTGELVLATNMSANSAEVFCSEDMGCLRDKMMADFLEWLVEATQ